MGVKQPYLIHISHKKELHLCYEFVLPFQAINNSESLKVCCRESWQTILVWLPVMFSVL